jgi:hypothetical protein
LRRAHAVLLAGDADDIAVLQRAPAAPLASAVDRHLALLDQQLGVAARRRRSGDLEERPEGQGARDEDVFRPCCRQLLKRIGMMR